MSNALHKHLEAFFNNKVKCGHTSVFIVTLGDFMCHFSYHRIIPQYLSTLLK